MTFSDPFYGYSFLLRAILYVAVPGFTVWQFVRLRRALHVFQLEGYKRNRFLSWCRSNPPRALFLRRASAKKPLVMTGRAWRLLVAATALSTLVVLLASAAAHLAGGWPYDIPVWAATTALAFAGAPVLLVAADVLLAPVQKAINARYLRAARRKLARLRPVVIGVTGSFGKTSTKFAIEALAGPAGSVLATPGSFNTPLGVCRTINEKLEEPHRFFVVEMGAYATGEIAELCRFVRPRIGVLTAIGPAHLDRFGSLDAIRKAKYEIVEQLPRDGVAVMNVDDREVRRLADKTAHVRVVRYGVDPSGDPDITAVAVDLTREGTSFTVEDRSERASLRVRTRLLGRYAVGHVLAAVAVARALGRPLGELAQPIETLRGVEHRLQLVEGGGGVVVIDDAYNSNPGGAAAALEVLEALPGSQKVVVTPGMVELGPLAFEENERLGERAASVADALIVVARTNRQALLSGAARANSGCEVIAVDSLTEARARLEKLLRPGAVVLFENDLPDQYEG
ncbi:MAG: UDP-N-acetylmuramoyl-tripeptide--D-alanyl-D-alanine ligase [Actinomycetota bacterium]|nr:UDP-N-acetylmuramoyl-tripeptide--D-alanyl-D-alanine ligase [Actinomycetota bacterium]